ncbi:MAG: class I SAM-dependent methyltransferase [Burkholderiales bacterium]|nr:class I SAM-dependent methyltransferase [Burkholderiales bacterium]MCW0190476.1 class I SAM-dependent methyltransferase [Rhodococcus sp. (in: high G+C Gram-positive bacteria)]
MTNQPIWDHFQSVGIDSFRNSAPRMRFLVARLRAGERVLNIGVGAGILEALALAKGVQIHALDPSPGAIAGLRERLDLGERAVVAGAEAIPHAAGTFDVVVMSEVLEHLDDDTLRRALVEVRRVLRAGGKLIVTVPHAENLADGEVVCPCCGHVFHRWGHVRRFDRATLCEVLSSHGFVIGRVSLEAFPDWQRRRLGNLLKSVARYLLGKCGASIAQICLYAEATVAAP